MSTLAQAHADARTKVSECVTEIEGAQVQRMLDVADEKPSGSTLLSATKRSGLSPLAVLTFLLHEVVECEDCGPEQLTECLDLCRHLTKWIERVMKRAVDEASAGKVPTGYKLFHRAHNRYWTKGPAETIRLLKSKYPNLKENDVARPPSPAQVEKLVGAIAYEKIAKYVSRPEGAEPYLVKVPDAVGRPRLP